MLEHERRRVTRDGDGSDRPPSPAEPALLALQRSAGNRAVARLLYDEAKGTVTGTSQYASQRVPWNKQTGRRRKGDDAAVKPDDPTLIELAKDAEIRRLIAAGLGVDRVGGLKIASPDELKKAGLESASGESGAHWEPVKTQIVESAASDTAIVHEGVIHRHNVQERVRKVMRPIDYFPEPDDLAGENPDMSAASIIAGKTNWQLACTLIALYNHDGIAKVKEIVGDDTIEDEVLPAVVALHNYYVGTKHWQYDDSAYRYPIMQEWGYRMIFNGESSWADLNKHVQLKNGQRYVFDIDGHTVMVSIKRDYGPKDAKVDSLSDVFQCHSHYLNYSPGAEFNKKVFYIWRR